MQRLPEPFQCGDARAAGQLRDDCLFLIEVDQCLAGVGTLNGGRSVQRLTTDLKVEFPDPQPGSTVHKGEMKQAPCWRWNLRASAQASLKV